MFLGGAHGSWEQREGFPFFRLFWKLPLCSLFLSARSVWKGDFAAYVMPTILRFDVFKLCKL